MNSRIVQITVIGFFIILLTLIGFNSMQNNALMNQLEQTLGSLIEATPQSTEATPPVEESTATGEAQEQGETKSTPDAPGDEEEQEQADQESNLKIILPGENDTVFLSQDQLEIQLHLVISPTLTTTDTISAQMFISHKTGTDNSKTPLPEGFSSKLAEGSIAQDPINLTIAFEKLPPSGTYEGWLVVTGNTSKIQPVSQRVTYEVSTALEKTIQHRLTGASVEDNKITISGIRTWPASLNWLKENPGGYLKTDDFPLVLWEANLQSIAEGESCEGEKFDYEIMASELVDLDQGLAGRLTVKEPEKGSEHPPCNSIRVNLGLQGIEHPGSYQGTLRIITPSNGQNQLIAVNALVRDTLVFPAIVIFLGTLLLGAAIRLNLGDAKKNTAYLNFRIVRARDRLRRVDPPFKESIWIKDLLQEAELLISINDLDKAQKALSEVEKKLGIPTLPEKLEIEPDLVERMSADCFITLHQPFIDRYIRVADWMQAYKGEELVFRLSKTDSTGAIVECLEASDVKWKLTKPIDDTTNEFVGESTDPHFKHAFRRKGKYTLEVTYTGCKPGEQSIALEVINDPVRDAAWTVKKKAWLSAALWAGIATVAGLVYIERRIPTFGAPTDYLMALAFALGLSAVSKPVENIADSIRKFFEKGKETKPGNDGDGGNGSSPAAENNDAGTKIPVPEGLEGKSWAEAKKAIEEAKLAAKPDPADAKDNWVVVSTDPEPPQKLNQGASIVCKLKSPDGENGKPKEEQTG